MAKVEKKVDLGRIPELDPHNLEDLPIYVQICDIFSHLVQEGLLLPEEILPGENQLAEYWNVSRATVRRAFRLLEEDGYVIKRQGAGTEVAFRPHSKPDVNLCAHNYCLIRQEILRSIDMSYGIEKCGTFIAKQLEITPGSELFACYFTYHTQDDSISCNSILMGQKVFEQLRINDTDESAIKSFMLHEIYKYASSSHIEVQAYSAKLQSDSTLNLPNADVIISISELLKDSYDRPLAVMKYQLDAAYYRLSMNKKIRTSVEIA